MPRVSPTLANTSRITATFSDRARRTTRTSGGIACRSVSLEVAQGVLTPYSTSASAEGAPRTASPQSRPQRTLNVVQVCLPLDPGAPLFKDRKLRYTEEARGTRHYQGVGLKRPPLVPADT